MILESILLLLFLIIFVFQVYRIKQLVVYEKKTTGLYIALVIGVVVILGITFYFEQNLLHTVTGIFGALILIGSLFVTGLTEDSFVYSSPPRSRRLIGQKRPFIKTKNIRIETFHEKKVIVRFISYKSERLVTFSKEDEHKVKDILGHHITRIL